jgi:hypothetical protein
MPYGSAPSVYEGSLFGQHGIDGTGVTVVVLDSGIDAGHPDLDYGTKTLLNLKSDSGYGPWYEIENRATKTPSIGDVVKAIIGQQKVTIENVQEFSGEGIDAIFDRMFSRDTTNLSAYSPEQVKRIIAGAFEPGMTKEEVIGELRKEGRSDDENPEALSL